MRKIIAPQQNETVACQEFQKGFPVFEFHL